MRPARDERRTASADTPGGADVLRSIAEEARREGEAALEAADAEGAALIQAARRSVASLVAEALEVADVAARAEAARTVNAARLRLVHRRAELAARRLDEVFAEAARRLDEIASGCDPDRWTRALQALARDGFERAGPGATVEVRPCDVGLLTSAAGPNVHIVGTLHVPGVRVRSADGRDEIDATLAGRLARARSAMADRVAGTLELGFGGAPYVSAAPDAAASSRGV